MKSAQQHDSLPGTEILKEQFQHEHDGTAGHRYLKQACAEPSSCNAYHQRHGTGSRLWVALTMAGKVMTASVT